MLREEFDKMLLNYLIHIEEYLCRNLYTPLLQPMEPTKDLGDKYNLTKNILKLIGWNNLNENEIVTVYNSKTNKDESYTVDFYANYDSRLKIMSVIKYLSIAISMQNTHLILNM